jgi:hypothetical protein
MHRSRPTQIQGKTSLPPGRIPIAVNNNNNNNNNDNNKANTS